MAYDYALRYGPSPAGPFTRVAGVSASATRRVWKRVRVLAARRVLAPA